MIIRKRHETVFTIEMTEAQADNLQKFLTVNADGHVNELSVQAEHGAEVADAVHETLNDLRDALMQR